MAATAAFVAGSCRQNRCKAATRSTRRSSRDCPPGRRRRRIQSPFPAMFPSSRSPPRPVCRATGPNMRLRGRAGSRNLGIGPPCRNPQRLAAQQRRHHLPRRNIQIGRLRDEQDATGQWGHHGRFALGCLSKALHQFLDVGWSSVVHNLKFCRVCYDTRIRQRLQHDDDIGLIEFQREEMLADQNVIVRYAPQRVPSVLRGAFELPEAGQDGVETCSTIPSPSSFHASMPLEWPAGANWVWIGSP